MAESKEELKSPLRKVKEENEKAGLKLNIKITKITANEGGQVEAVTGFLFLGSKITRMVTAAMKLEDDCFLTGKL